MKTDNETVLVPTHYARWKIEPIFAIMANGLDYARGNIIKYLLRWDAKDGIKDLYKAARYLDQYTTMEEEKASGVPTIRMTFADHPHLGEVLRRYIRRNDVRPTQRDIDELSKLMKELTDGPSRPDTKAA